MLLTNTGSNVSAYVFIAIVIAVIFAVDAAHHCGGTTSGSGARGTMMTTGLPRRSRVDRCGATTAVFFSSGIMGDEAPERLFYSALARDALRVFAEWRGRCMLDGLGPDVFGAVLRGLEIAERHSIANVVRQPRRHPSSVVEPNRRLDGGLSFGGVPMRNASVGIQEAAIRTE